jgi:lysophospholipase L1-like esterase
MPQDMTKETEIREPVEILPKNIGGMTAVETAPLLERAALRTEVLGWKGEFWDGLRENLRGAKAWVESQGAEATKKTLRVITTAAFVTTCFSACAKGPSTPYIPSETAPRVTEVSSTAIPTETTVPPTATLTPTSTETATSLPTETEHFTTPKILLLGDSMIAITKVPTCLSDLLKNSGIPADFVGDKTSFGNDVPTDGLGGFDTTLMLRQLTRGTDWTELNGTQFPDNFSDHIPDIVIIQLGTNDAINSITGKWDPVPIYNENMKGIVKFLRSKNPNVKIIIPMLIPSAWSNYTAKIDLINSDIPDLVKSLDEPGSRVVTTVNLKGEWQSSYFRDNVHPNDDGVQEMAKAYFDALVENQFVPDPSYNKNLG